MAASSRQPETMKAECSLDNPKACYSETSDPMLHVTLLGGEWSSSAGGLSTLNRELAIHLSNHSAVKVSLLVPEGACNYEEKNEAHTYGITIVEAKRLAAFDRLDWLSFPPHEHLMDIVVGHGVKLGRQIQVIRDSARFTNCKWVQVVHTAPEDLSKYKCYGDPISKGETKHESEVELCKLADLVVPVGPKLKETYTSYLQRCKTDQDVLSITPGLFQREFGDLVAKQDPNEDGEFKVLLFGRGDDEDFELKGYNIAAKAFTDQRLKNKPYHLIFVGAPEGKQEEVREKLLQRGIAKAQLTVRKFIQSRERLKDLLCEADLAIMPSKSEGFGLAALEALSAGLPILVGSRSGFAKALENVPIGFSCIVNSDDPAAWAEAVEAVRSRHRMRLQEIKSLRALYGEMYSWKEQCEALVNRMQRMGHEPSMEIDNNQRTNTSNYEQLVSETSLTSDCEMKADAASGNPTEISTNTDSQSKNSRKRKMLEFSCNPGTSSEDSGILFKKHIPSKIASLEGESSLGMEPLKSWSMQSIAGSTSSTEDASDIPEGVSVTEKQPVAKTHVLASGFSGEQCPVNEKINTEDAARLSEESRPICHTPSVSGCTSDQETANTVKMSITTRDLSSELEDVVDRMLRYQLEVYLKYNKTAKLSTANGLSDFVKHLESTYNFSLTSVGMGSLVINGQCPDLQSLESLWNDYHSGVLNEAAENLLVTDDIKKEISLETVKLKTIIEVDSYLICKKALTEKSGVAGINETSSQTAYKGQLEDTGWSDKSSGVAKDKKLVLTRMERAEMAKASRGPLHKAAISGHYETVKMLLENSHDVNQRDQFSLTPLHLACWYGQESVVKLLLKHGANVQAKDRFQRTPLQKAERQNHHSIMQLLLKNVARPSFHQPVSLKNLSRKAFLQVDKKSGFNLLQAAVFEQDNNIIFKASLLLDNFVKEMENVITGYNAAKFLAGKTAADILVPRLLTRTGYNDDPMRRASQRLYKECAKENRQLTELQWGTCIDDAEQAVELVLTDSVDVNASGSDNDYTALLHASRSSSSQFIETLIDLGADVNAQRRETKVTPLLLAADCNNYMASCLLVEHGTEVNAQDRYGLTALHLSVKKNHDHLVKLLVTNKATVNIEDNHGNTPLHWCATNGNENLCRLLLEHNADVNIQGKDGYTPLHWCALKGHENLCRLLLKHNADVNSQDNYGYTPLHRCASTGNENLCRLLLKHNADVNIQNKDGHTALHLAVKDRCDENLLRFCLEHHADVNIQNYRGYTALHLAVEMRDENLVRLLLKHNADVNIQGNNGRTVLQLAVEVRDENLVRLCLDNHADVSIQDNDGYTALHLAVKGQSKARDKNLVRLLLKHNADVNIQCKNGHTVLQLAVELRDENLVRLCLDNHADVSIQDNDGYTALHLSVKGQSKARDENLVRLLLKHNANVNIQCKNGYTVLQLAVELRDENLVRLCLDNHADVNVQDNDGYTALHLAVKGGDENLVRLCLEHHADVNTQSKDGNTPLFLAVMRNDENLVRLSLEHHVDLSIQNKDGYTPLHMSVMLDNENLLRLFLEHKADVNSQSKDGSTLLHQSVKSHDENLVSLLLQHHADVNIQDDNGYTPLHRSVITGVENLVRLLLEYNADVNIHQKDGFTPLHLSACYRVKNCSQIIDLLLQYGVQNIDICDAEGLTPLQMAVRRGNAQAVKRLVDLGADVSVFKDAVKLERLKNRKKCGVAS